MLAAEGELKGEPDHGGVWLMDIKENIVQYLTEGEASAWSSSGDFLAIIHTRSPAPYLKLVNLKTKEERTIYKFDNIETIQQEDLEWSSKNDTFALTITGADSEGYRFDRLYLLSSDGSYFKPLVANPQWSMHNPIWLHKSGWIAFLSKTSDDYVISAAPDTGECIVSWLPESIKADTFDISPDGKKLVLIYFGKVYLVDIEEVVGSLALPDELKCP